MRNEYFFRVAGLLFSVSLPSGWDAEALLPSFRPFRCGACPEGKRIFRLLAATLPFAGGGERAELLGESSNDMGHVRLLRTPDGYRTEISYGPSAGAAVHVMVSDPAFDNAAAFLRPEDPYLGEALSSMLRILYAQAALVRDAVSVHASCVSLEGRGYLFLGRSGTGKSTHARRWMEAFPGCRLLNDDNPVLRVEDGTVTAYGTPWSGKTPCLLQERMRARGRNRPPATVPAEPVHPALRPRGLRRPAALLFRRPPGRAVAGRAPRHPGAGGRAGARRMARMPARPGGRAALS